MDSTQAVHLTVASPTLFLKAFQVYFSVHACRNAVHMKYMTGVISHKEG